MQARRHRSAVAGSNPHVSDDLSFGDFGADRQPRLRRFVRGTQSVGMIDRDDRRSRHRADEADDAR
jgi:hypothetical protein